LFCYSIFAKRNEDGDKSLSSQADIADPTLCRMLRKHIKTLHKQIALLEKQIEELIVEDDESVMEHIGSVPGVGKKTVIALLTATKGMHGFDNFRRLAIGQKFFE